MRIPGSGFICDCVVAMTDALSPLLDQISQEDTIKLSCRFNELMQPVELLITRIRLALWTSKAKKKIEADGDLDKKYYHGLMLENDDDFPSYCVKCHPHGKVVTHNTVSDWYDGSKCKNCGGELPPCDCNREDLMNVLIADEVKMSARLGF